MERWQHSSAASDPLSRLIGHVPSQQDSLRSRKVSPSRLHRVARPLPHLEPGSPLESCPADPNWVITAPQPSANPRLASGHRGASGNCPYPVSLSYPWVEAEQPSARWPVCNPSSPSQPENSTRSFQRHEISSLRSVPFLAHSLHSSQLRIALGPGSQARARFGRAFHPRAGDSLRAITS